MSELTDYLNCRCAEMDYEIYSDAFDMAEADEALIEGLSKLVRDIIVSIGYDGYDVIEFTNRAYDLGVDLMKRDGR